MDHPELAQRIQRAVPLCAEPFVALGAELALPAEEVLSTLEGWMAAGSLREISGVLESEAFGWDSALIAASVPEERIEAVAAVVGAHPCVTHNYEREHHFNLWFTLAVPPRMGLDHTLRLMEQEADAGPFSPLRRSRTFKISVRMDPTTRRNHSTELARREPIPRLRPSAREKRLFRLLQTPLPLCARPFMVLASQAGISEDELLTFAHRHEGGAMRRYGATFRHRRLGVRGNIMSAWQVPEQRIEEVGLALAALPEVSHCYARDVIADFPYPLFAMIHGPDRGTSAGIARRLAAELTLPEPALLLSSREFKKCRLRYFLPELQEWWDAREPIRRTA